MAGSNNLHLGAPSEVYFTRAFQSVPIIAILRGHSPEATVELCETAWAAGIEYVEVPIQDRAGVDSLRAALATAGGRPVGAGTVIREDQVELAAGLGAAFAVAPNWDLPIARACHNAGLPLLPGVATATEIAAAMSAGFVWLKGFPAAQLTPAWFRAQHGPFPDAQFVATGGIDVGNADTFLDAGAKVVAVGGALSDPAHVGELASLMNRRVEGLRA